MHDKILRLPAVLEATGLKRTSLYMMRRDGGFPQPVQIGKRAVGWRQSDIQKWIDQRATMRVGQ
ncbi:transcriptional regulator, AlpA family [Microbulbifer thermotolerans]|uniref:helix-turn-helix transcriptional regulator n=1 Tax=Microbulbifer thermotolerans TaxID=252514 RepID=UPI0008E34EE3|nr:AlpA family transcriptional regulator [Microbulbifer thermotolerans]SFB94507.1 transcriptional regulator, AlpA family [Microbulbifer thermotolerans]